MDFKNLIYTIDDADATMQVQIELGIGRTYGHARR
jgi:hypothetical protein